MGFGRGAETDAGSGLRKLASLGGFVAVLVRDKQNKASTVLACSVSLSVLYQKRSWAWTLNFTSPLGSDSKDRTVVLQRRRPTTLLRTESAGYGATNTFRLVKKKRSNTQHTAQRARKQR